MQGAVVVLESKFEHKDSEMVALRMRLEEAVKSELRAKEAVVFERNSMDQVEHKVGELERQVEVECIN